MPDKQDELQPIIIKKVKKGDHPHHGGAWKVAYADFVTAMMAFFLLLWLISSTSDAQKEGIAEYFSSTPMITRSESGASGLLSGTTVAIDGALTKQVQPLVEKPATQTPTLRDRTDITDSEFEAAKKAREEKAFKQAEEALKKALESNPELKELSSALKIDMTPEGLRIQIIDQEGRPLFASGSAELMPHTKKLLRTVSEVIAKLPNEISVRGHTDSVPYGPGASYTNWELSADRANSSRRMLKQSGLPASRINNVVGKADTDHLFADNPRDGRNRRISIILLHEGITTKEGANKSSRAVRKQEEETKRQLYQRSEGEISFP
jgi:chemotaxis protein MotB